MRRVKWFVVLSMGLSSQLFAFNMQGRLASPAGVPVTAPTQVEFRLYSGGTVDTADGGQVLYKERAVINPNSEGVYQHVVGHGTPIEDHTLTAEDFLASEPLFLQINMAGIPLLPRIQIVSHPISVVSDISKTVLNESIQPRHLNSEISEKLMPSGMIALFNQGCPAGWSRFSALDGRFPMGNIQAGTTGGASQHIHPISSDGTHNHNHTTEVVKLGSRVAPPGPAFDEFEFTEDVGVTSQKRWGRHRHNINPDGAHNHTGGTGSTDNLPPFRTVIYCEKN